MKRQSTNRTLLLFLTLVLAAVMPLCSEAQQQPGVLLQQSQSDADRKSAGCLTCHTSYR